MCGSNPNTTSLIFSSNPAITEMTTMSTATPRVTPSTEISVMIETKVRFGLRYRSAKNRLNFELNGRTEYATGKNCLRNTNYSQLA